jgi:hypothetical protein
MLTGIIVKRILSYLKEHGLLPAEHKACHSGSERCKDHLLKSKTVSEDCRKRRKSLNIARIDNQGIV